MKILIRADASIEIGTGHIVRCLAIADKFKDRSIKPDFLCKSITNNLKALILSKGYRVISYENIEVQYDVCLIDQYSLGVVDEDQLRKYASKIISIDDSGFRVHNVDTIIDPSICSDSLIRSSKNPETEFHYGSDWLIIRDEFKNAKKQVIVKNEFKKVLVFFGGTDPKNLILDYINEILKNLKNFETLKFNFLISDNHPHADKIKSLSLPENIVVHYNPLSVSKLMLDCDLYLGSGGSITWERMCLALTGFVISVAENQEDAARTLDAQKFHFYLGKSENVSPKEALNALIINDEMRLKLIQYSKRCFDQIDAKGLDRVVDLICNSHSSFA